MKLIFSSSSSRLAVSISSYMSRQSPLSFNATSRSFSVYCTYCTEGILSNVADLTRCYLTGRRGFIFFSTYIPGGRSVMGEYQFTKRIQEAILVILYHIAHRPTLIIRIPVSAYTGSLPDRAWETLSNRGSTVVVNRSCCSVPDIVNVLLSFRDNSLKIVDLVPKAIEISTYPSSYKSLGTANSVRLSSLFFRHWRQCLMTLPMATMGFVNCLLLSSYRLMLIQLGLKSRKDYSLNANTRESINLDNLSSSIFYQHP